MRDSTLPLILETSPDGGRLPYLDLAVDGRRLRFLLDTGAPHSSVPSTPPFDAYPAIDATESRGASGQAVTVDIIRAASVTLGPQRFTDVPLQRAGAAILGLDLLAARGFEIDYQRRTLSFVDAADATRPLRRLKRGHIILSVTLGDHEAAALFDTGADTTVIDQALVDARPELFDVLEDTTGTDAHGRSVASQRLRCRSLSVPGLVVEDLDMAAFPFPEVLRERMEGAAMILGNNVIGRARWRVDGKKQRWSLDPYA